MSLVIDGQSIFAGVLFITGYMLLRVFFYGYGARLANMSPESPAKMFALITCALDLGLLVGASARGLTSELGGNSLFILAIGTVYLLLVASLLLVARHKRILSGLEIAFQNSPQQRENVSDAMPPNDNQQTRSEMDKTASPKDYVDVIGARSEILAEECGLSPREAEIVALIARGRTLKSISEELYISMNTVKTHVSHVYQKCDVHTREELIGLVENTKGV